MFHSSMRTRAFRATGVAVVIGLSIPGAGAAPQTLQLDWKTGAHVGPVNSITVSDNAEKFLTTGADGTARIWSLSGTRMQILPAGSASHFVAADVTSAGTSAVYADSLGVLRAADSNANLTWSHSNLVEGNVNDVEVLVGDTRFVVAGDEGATVRSMTNGAVQFSLQSGAPIVSAASCSLRIFATATDSDVEIWDVQTSARVGRVDTPDGVTRIELSHDASTLAVLSTTNGVDVYNPHLAQRLLTVPDPLGEFRDVELSSDGSLVYVGTFDGTVRAISVSSGAVVWSQPTYTGTVTDIEMLGGWPIVIYSTFSGSTAGRDATTGAFISTISDISGHHWSGAITTGGTVTSVGTWPQVVSRQVASAAVTQLLFSADQSGVPVVGFDGSPIDRGTVRSIAAAANGSILAGGALDGRLKTWSTSSGQLLQSLPLSANLVRCVEVNATGTTVFGLTAEGQLTSVQAASGTTNWTTPALSTSSFGALHANPNGSRLVAGDSEGRLFLIDAATGSVLSSIQPSNRMILDLAFSSDGATVFAADYAGETWRWPTGGTTFNSIHASSSGRAAGVCRYEGTDKILILSSNGFVWRYSPTTQQVDAVQVSNRIDDALGIESAAGKIAVLGRLGVVAVYTPTGI